MYRWKKLKCDECGHVSKNALWDGTITINGKTLPLKGYVKYNRDETFHLDKIVHKIENATNSDADEFEGSAHCIKCGNIL